MIAARIGGLRLRLQSALVNRGRRGSPCGQPDCVRDHRGLCTGRADYDQSRIRPFLVAIGTCRDQFDRRPHRPPSRPLRPDHRHCARTRHRSGPDPRAVGRRGRHQGRQPVLHGRGGQGRCDPRQPEEPHRQGRGPDEAAPGAAGIHHRDLGRHPQRHPRNALLADRARGDQRCAVRTSRAPPGLPAPSRSSPATSRRSARWPRCSSTINPRSSCRTAPIHPGTDPNDRREARHRQRLSGRRQSRRRISPPHRLPCLPGLRQLRRHVHLQHHADLHRRRRHAAAAHGGAAVRRSAPRQGIPGPTGRLPRADDREGPEAARHRRPRFDPQRRHRRDGDRRLDQRHAACAGDRARRRLRRLLERSHDAGRVQPSVAVRRAGAHRRAPLRQIFDGRHRRGRRRAGDRARTAGGRAAQWRRHDLHRRNAGRAGQAPRHQVRPTAR